ncbi:MAG: PLP-dependent aminotransferase family protein [Geminicoccaceae bacterium]
MPTNSGTLDLALRLDGVTGSQSSRVHAALRGAILEGRLGAGTRLPSSRALADQLGLRRNAVVVAYEHLLSDGLAEARVGAGTYVTTHLRHVTERTVSVSTMRPVRNQTPFALGRTHADPVLLQRLGSAVRRRLAAADPSHFGYGDPRGSEALRGALAKHLAATRGLRCDPGHILITSGTQQGLRLCGEALLRPGDAIWVEDPGYPAARRLFEAIGAETVAVPVDGAGLIVDEGRRRAPGARLAYVTPSHQFPTGVPMGMERRVALLEWARRADAWILEDDYDSEFRYAGPPLTALAGIDGHARVAYLGTFSKTLFPGLRIGFLIVPPALLPAIATARGAADRFPPSLLADAVADLVRDGTFAAHVRRMRSRYRSARDLVTATLIRASNGLLGVSVPGQGLHLVATLPPGTPIGAAAAIRAAAEVEAWLLSETRTAQVGPDGFVLGFSGHEPSRLKQAAERLGEAVRGYRGDR